MINNKKAQMEAEKLGGYAIVIVLVIIILIGLGITWAITQGIINIFPNQLAQSATTCAGYATPSEDVSAQALAVSYCTYNDFKNLDGKAQLANCPYIHERAIAVLGADKVTWELKQCAETPAQKCAQLKADTPAGKTFKDTIVVNGKTCKDWAVIPSCKPKYPDAVCTGLAVTPAEASACDTTPGCAILTGEPPTCINFDCAGYSENDCKTAAVPALLCNWA